MAQHQFGSISPIDTAPPELPPCENLATQTCQAGTSENTQELAPHSKGIDKETDNFRLTIDSIKPPCARQHLASFHLTMVLLDINDCYRSHSWISYPLDVLSLK